MGESSKKAKTTKPSLIPRFSHIKDANDVPFFQMYNRQPDPVLEQEHRKMRKSEFPLLKPKRKYQKDEKKKDEKKKDQKKKDVVYAKIPTPKVNSKRGVRNEKGAMKLENVPSINLPKHVNLEKAIKRRILQKPLSKSSVEYLDPEKSLVSEISLPRFRPVSSAREDYFERKRKFKAAKKKLSDDMSVDPASSYLNKVLSATQKRQEEVIDNSKTEVLNNENPNKLYDVHKSRWSINKKGSASKRASHSQ